MSPWTQYDIDLRPPDQDRDISISILRNGNELIYAVGPNPGQPGTLPAWSLIKLNCELGTSTRSRHTYPSFIEATRAYRSGAVIWGGAK